MNKLVFVSVLQPYMTGIRVGNAATELGRLEIQIGSHELWKNVHVCVSCLGEALYSLLSIFSDNLTN